MNDTEGVQSTIISMSKFDLKKESDMITAMNYFAWNIFHFVK